MPRMPEFDPINYLVAKRFPPQLNASRSPFANDEAQIQFAERESAIEAYVEELRAKSTAEIDILVKAQWKKQAELEQLRMKDEEAARWYNKPICVADFEHWSKAAYWSLEEGIALSFGKEPTRIKWETIKNHIQISSFVVHYEKRLELAKRASAMKHIGSTNLPGVFLDWAKRNEIDVPAKLIKLVEARGHIFADWPGLLKQSRQQTSDALVLAEKHRTDAIEYIDKTATAHKSEMRTLTERITALEAENRDLASKNTQSEPEKIMNPKSKQSLLKLVLGMAMDGYGFDPKLPRSALSRELSADLSSFGIAIDETTVRDWLHKAMEEVDYLPKT